MFHCINSLCTYLVTRAAWNFYDEVTIKNNIIMCSLGKTYVEMHECTFTQ